MIFSAAAGAVVKKAFGSKAFQTNTSKIAKNLILDPATTQMQSVVLVAKDVSGPLAKSLVNAVADKHPDVNVIYLYRDDKEGQLLNGDISKYKVKKVTDDVVKDCVLKSAANQEITEKETIFVSNDNKVLEDIDNTEEQTKKKGFTFGRKRVQPVEQETNQRKVSEEKERVEEEQDELVNKVTEEDMKTVEYHESMQIEKKIEELEVVNPLMKDDEFVDALKKKDKEQFTPQPEKPTHKSIEQRIKQLNDYQDWDLLQHATDRDSIYRELMSDSISFSNCVTHMETLQRRIENIYADPSIPVDNKMYLIREAGIDRTGKKSELNNIMAMKLQSIMDCILDCATKQIDKRLTEIKQSLNNLTTYREISMDEEKLRKLTDTRLALRLELGELAMAIEMTWKTMDSNIQDFLSKMTEGLPTEDAFLNELQKPARVFFVPDNASEIFNRLSEAVDSKRVAMSALDSKIKNMYTALLKLCEVDDEIIKAQKFFIEALKVRRVEERVVMTNCMKSALSVYVGERNSGVTATTLTWSGVLSRRRNTLLVDLRSKSSVERYGESTIELSEFLDSTMEKALVVTHEDIGNDKERLDEILEKLNEKLHYYHHINFIMDTDQHELIQRLELSCRVCNFITDCTPHSIDTIKDLISKISLHNVAEKLVAIDPVIDSIALTTQVGLDPTSCQFVGLPYIKDIKTCTLKGYRPYERREILEIFEEAFR